ncbi:MAG: sulfite exporter TauE/SafE family protein [Firmicutes bacterium]|nr:sulfite exporter TauE/SafE family protein [[Eubacterium] siraeum]MCM1488685.1 sulfite exporter TauE/SafE family protein [Bacillota bacterium]
MNIIIGLLSGIAASMGFGGGFVLIIYLTAFADVNQIAAQGVNLLFFLPVAFISLLIHQKNKLIQWKVLFRLIPGGILGILAGAFISAHIDVELLQKMFGALLIFVGFKEIFHKNNEKDLTKSKKSNIIKYNEMR